MAGAAMTPDGLNLHEGTVAELQAKVDRLTTRIMEMRAVECPNCAEWQRVNRRLVIENRELKDKLAGREAEDHRA